MNDFEPEKDEDVERELPLPDEVDVERELPLPDEEDDERELPLPDEEDDDLEEDEDLDEDVFEEEESSSSRAPQVSFVLSSTSRAERETEGLRVLSPGSSMAVSSYGAMKSSMRPPPTGASPGPAERIGMAQNAAANAVRMYLIVISPVESFGSGENRVEGIQSLLYYKAFFGKIKRECAYYLKY